MGWNHSHQPDFPDLVLALKRRGMIGLGMIVNHGRGKGHSGKSPRFLRYHIARKHLCLSTC